MAENLTEKTVSIKLNSDIPLSVFDDEGRVIGSARLEGTVNVTIIVDRHHPSSFDLDTDNGLAKLKLVALINDNVVDGALTIGV
jgi:hypothetical protein